MVTSVNDPFVMDAWATSMCVNKRLTLVADGLGELAKALHMATYRYVSD